MVRASYVSSQSALAHYGLIPEYVPVTTSVTTGERRRWDTPLGTYEFRQIKRELFRGYQMVELAGRQRAFVATPEKALLDLVYLTPGADSPDYLVELRLQRLDRLDLETLQREAELFNKPKLRRAAARVADLVRAESSEYETV
jgi:predicted transcriptional regulator of viral defense system